MRNLPRCSCVTRNGSPCGRRVSDGSNPPVCHVHRLQQQGKGTSALTQPVERSPLEIIQRLMRDRDPSIRLRAANAYLDHLGKPQPDARPTEWHDFVKALSENERVEMLALLQALDEFKKRIYTREPDLRPDSEMRPTVTPRKEPNHEQDPTRRLDEAVSEPPAVKPAAGEPRRDQGRHREAKLGREQWQAVGLFEARGFITHALGDDHAARILRGEISYDQAVADEKEALRRADEMACGNARRLS
jgi:hypothetical protein